MARAGMTNLIAELRAMTQATSADYTLGQTSYWTDDQLQTVLDRSRRDLNHHALVVRVEYQGGGIGQPGTSIYKDYYASFGNFEEYSSEGGAAVWVVEDGAGNDMSTALYTVDYTIGHVRFTNDQRGTAYYLRGRSYDLSAAAAHVWKVKAGWRVQHVTFQADDQMFKQSDWFSHCMTMAKYYESMAGPRMTIMTRTDMT